MSLQEMINAAKKEESGSILDAIKNSEVQVLKCAECEGPVSVGLAKENQEQLDRFNQVGPSGKTHPVCSGCTKKLLTAPPPVKEEPEKETGGKELKTIPCGLCDQTPPRRPYKEHAITNKDRLEHLAVAKQDAREALDKAAQIGFHPVCNVCYRELAKEIGVPHKATLEELKAGAGAKQETPFKERIIELERERDGLIKDNAHLEAGIKALGIDLKKRDGTVDELKKALWDFQGENETLTGQNSILEKDIKDLEKNLKTQTELVAALKAELDKKSKVTASKSAGISVALSGITEGALDKMRQEFVEEFIRIQNDIDSVRNSVGALQSGSHTSPLRKTEEDKPPGNGLKAKEQAAFDAHVYRMRNPGCSWEAIHANVKSPFSSPGEFVSFFDPNIEEILKKWKSAP